MQTLISVCRNLRERKGGQSPVLEDSFSCRCSLVFGEDLGEVSTQVSGPQGVVFTWMN